MTVPDSRSGSTVEHPADGTVRRGPIETERPTPGPEYLLPPCFGAENHDITKIKAPAYSIALPLRREQSMVPGPNAYTYGDRVTARGPQQAPRYSLRSRYAQKEPEVTPGPGHYRADRVRCGVMSAERTPRAVTLVGKERYTWKSWAPPPSKYAVPATFGTGSVDKAGGKSWSIGLNRDYGSIHYDGKVKATPCASKYGAVDAGVYKKSSPAFSQVGRTKVPIYNSSLKNPGPGSYDPKPARGHSAGPTFGTRHSKYIMPLITCNDFY